MIQNIYYHLCLWHQFKTNHSILQDNALNREAVLRKERAQVNHEDFLREIVLHKAHVHKEAPRRKVIVHKRLHARNQVLVSSDNEEMSKEWSI